MLWAVNNGAGMQQLGLTEGALTGGLHNYE